MPPAGEPKVDGEKDRMILWATSKIRKFFKADSSVNIRKTGFDDVGRVSKGNR